MRFRPAIFIWFVFAQSFFKCHKNGNTRKLKAWSFRLWKSDSCRLYNERARALCICRVYKKKVIELWSALASSLYNLQKSLFHSRKDRAFSLRMLPFLWHLKKDWANTNQMKIPGRNRIFPPLSIIMAANKKKKSISHLSVTRNN